ncbi:hypothetical protein ZEAMMB73_Zm00001d027497 [Zea mays]|uniref:Uncharacterized protein n=1 Tax=Zea mays TaxID=4577 RepID=A0A1D6JMJ7_MAIZE|nr:hypothetical protein ZEAMMB73_Zm00001d027497 [Zea mays]
MLPCLMPINVPGTNYSKGLQARKKLVAMLRQMIADRRSSGCTRDDMLDALLSGNEGTRAKLSDDQIIDLLITLIYSGYETVSTTSMMAVKYLSDNPKALGQIRKEHLDIRKAKSPEDPLDWNDYKSMTFTKAIELPLHSTDASGSSTMYMV